LKRVFKKGREKGNVLYEHPWVSISGVHGPGWVDSFPWRVGQARIEKILGGPGWAG
jgi:hypothetical protein